MPAASQADRSARSADGARLDLQQLSKAYGAKQALDEISLSLTPGEMHGFVGQNGAGKTTAMRIAIGVLEADSGEVLWNGHPIRDADRRAIGYMPEERGLYPKMKVAEQLIYLARIHGRDEHTATERTYHWIERMGIAAHAEDRVEALSLGNQQRVQLAASLVFDPELLILDEPFSGLDPIGTDVLAEVLLETCRAGVAVLFSSHQLDLVERLCDRVTIIQSGRIVESGGVSDLREAGSRGLWEMVTADELDFRHLPTGVEQIDAALYKVRSESDAQALLDAGRRHSEVHRFGRAEVSLTGLFREHVDEATYR